MQRIVIEKGRAAGLDVLDNGMPRHFRATRQIVLSMGAVNSPRIRTRSSICHEDELKRLGIPVVQPLPGVGDSLQEQLCLPIVFEYRKPMLSRGNASETTIYAALYSESASPDVLICQGKMPFRSPEVAAR